MEGAPRGGRPQSRPRRRRLGGLVAIAKAAACFALCVSLAGGQGARLTPDNYDESKVKPYTLPDPLVSADGKPVRTAAEWIKRRRPEILRIYQTLIFGRTPPPPYRTSAEASPGEPALGGMAIRKQVTIDLTGKPSGPKMHLLIYLPASAKRPVPAFLGLNFDGNHTVHADPGIRLAQVWVRDPTAPRGLPLGTPAPYLQKTADEKSRGSSAAQWQVERILARGYALATIYYGDIEPDFIGGMPHGVRPLFFKPGQTEPAPDEWGAIGAWAWGLSRALDYLQSKEKQIDARRIAVMGHSRLGKTALWAGAQDQRFAMVISNESGEGGAALSKRNFGESVEHLNVAFPHWYCVNFRKYNNREEELPVDAHELIALSAPRPVYVASAEQDHEADPKGEFLAAVHAGPVYALFGKHGIVGDQMPGVHQPVGDRVAYHLRAGRHDVTEYDWDRYLDFADKHLRE